MLRLPLLLVLCLPLIATAQSSPSGPRIDLNAAGDAGTGGSTGEGTASVSGKLVVPAGWQLSIHTLTIRFAKNGGKTTLNAFVPVKGSLDFSAKINLKSGNYKVWAVIDVKDADGREWQISSQPQNIDVK